MPGGRPGRRRPHVLLTMLTLAAAVLTAAGCSSSSSSSASSAGGPAQSASGAASTSSAAAPTGSAAPSNEIGVTATQIHVAFIADVNTPVAPGLFQKSVDAVNAWAKIVNASGGLAGRQLAVDFCDGKLDANATTNCVIKACQNDFAMITQADVLTDLSDIDGCKNQQGQPVGLPNLAAIAFPPLTCDKDTYTISGQSAYCATESDNPQTYTVNVGDFRYYTSHFTGLHGLWVYNGDVPTVRILSVPGFQAGSNIGIGKDGQGFYSSIGRGAAERDDPVRAGAEAVGVDLRLRRLHPRQQRPAAQGGATAGGQLGQGLGLQLGLLRPEVHHPGRLGRQRHLRAAEQPAVPERVPGQRGAVGARQAGGLGIWTWTTTPSTPISRRCCSRTRCRRRRRPAR